MNNIYDKYSSILSDEAVMDLSDNSITKIIDGKKVTIRQIETPEELAKKEEKNKKQLEIESANENIGNISAMFNIIANRVICINNKVSKSEDISDKEEEFLNEFNNSFKDIILITNDLSKLMMDMYN